MDLFGAEVPQQGGKRQLNLCGSTVSLAESQDKKFKPQIDFRFLKNLFGDYFVFAKTFDNSFNVKTLSET